MAPSRLIPQEKKNYQQFRAEQAKSLNLNTHTHMMMRNIKSDREKKKTSAKTKGIFNYSLKRTHKICNEISTRASRGEMGIGKSLVFIWQIKLSLCFLIR